MPNLGDIATVLGHGFLGAAGPSGRNSSASLLNNRRSALLEADKMRREEEVRQEEQRLAQGKLRFQTLAEALPTIKNEADKKIVTDLLKQTVTEFNLGLTPEDIDALALVPSKVDTRLIKTMENGKPVERIVPDEPASYPSQPPSPAVKVEISQGSKPFPISELRQITDSQGNHPPIGTTPDTLDRNRFNVVSEPLPETAQDNFNQAFDALDSLGMMERNLGETGIVYGNVVGRVGAATGLNEGAIEFQTGRANMKLAAQALIKGIPSNFDVQTVINTLPEIGKPEPVNQSRINYSKELLNNLVKRTVAYYKGTGKVIPEEIIVEAEKRGIKIQSVEPWDGKGDPMDGIEPPLPTYTLEQAKKQPKGTLFRDPNGVTRQVP